MKWLWLLPNLAIVSVEAYGAAWSIVHHELVLVLCCLMAWAFFTQRCAVVARKIGDGRR